MRKQSDRSIIFLVKLIVLCFISQMLPISGAFADANFNFNLNFGKSNNNAPPPAAPSTTNWTGSWNTSWESGTATLYLFQAGYSVTGYYGYKEGIVKGVVEGNTLRGTYTQSNSSGSFIFSMAPDGNSFTGTYKNSKWWNGSRVASWSGAWETKWEGTTTVVYMLQVGNQVSGFYEYKDGKIIGNVNGNMLVGSWYQSNSHGPFSFNMGPSGSLFTGTYNHTKWWKGRRVNTGITQWAIDKLMK